MTVLEFVRGTFEQLDQHFVAAVGGRRVSCQRGCTACCYQLSTCGVGEALYLADEISEWPDWQAWVGRLVAVARQVTPAPTRMEWFRRQIACPFLDLATRDCRVYARRPGACRWHAVASDPKHCEPGAGEPYTARYDVSALQAALMRMDRDIQAENPFLREGSEAPVALSVLHAMAVGLDTKAERRFVRRAIEGLPTPRQWCEDFLLVSAERKAFIRDAIDPSSHR